jgi:hypothetical protein
MKWLHTVVLALAMLGISTVYANDAVTSGTNWESQGIVNPSDSTDVLATSSEVNDYLNETGAANHSHNYNQPDRDNPMGIGADLVVYQTESKNVGVEIQEKYDFANKENSVYVVAKINVFDMFKKKVVKEEEKAQ